VFSTRIKVLQKNSEYVLVQHFWSHHTYLSFENYENTQILFSYHLHACYFGRRKGKKGKIPVPDKQKEIGKIVEGSLFLFFLSKPLFVNC
jgi:hypothetical protein